MMEPTKNQERKCTVCGDTFAGEELGIVTARRSCTTLDARGWLHHERREVCVITSGQVVIHHCETLPEALQGEFT